MTSAPGSHTTPPPTLPPLPLLSELSQSWMHSNLNSREDHALEGLCGLSFSNCQAHGVKQHSTGV